MASRDAGLLVFTAVSFPPTLDRAEPCDRHNVASVTMRGFQGEGIKGPEASALLSFRQLTPRKPAAMSSGHSGGPVERPISSGHSGSPVERPMWKGADACSPRPATL